MLPLLPNSKFNTSKFNAVAKLLLLVFSLFTLAGCHAHHHRETKVATVNLNAEHGKVGIVIVTKPGKRKGCRRHGHHWHCRGYAKMN